MVRRLTVAGVLAGLCLGVLGLPTQALDRGNMGTLSPENRRIDNDYPRILGVYPNQDAGGNERDFFAYYRPPACQTATYCDSHELDVTYPDHFVREVFFGMRVTVTWDNPRTKDNPNGNDVDLFLWGDAGPAAGGPSSKCGSPNTQGDVHDCDHLEKEVITIFGPDDTEPEKTGDDDKDPLFFTVVNDEGINNGYTFIAEFFVFDPEFSEFEEFEVPQHDASTGSTASTTPADGPAGSDLSDLGTNVQGPDEEPRKVLVPGPDGELVEMDLPVLAAGAELEPRNQGGIWNPITWGVIAAILLGSGVAFVVLHRRRRAAEGDLY